MKGRWFLGVVSGFLFGLLLGVTLFLFGAVPLHSQWLWILPLVGIVLGLAMAAWAPFGSGGGDAAPATAAPTPSTPTQTDTTLEHDVVPAEPTDTAPDQPDDV